MWTPLGRSEEEGKFRLNDQSIQEDLRGTIILEGPINCLRVCFSFGTGPRKWLLFIYFTYDGSLHGLVRVYFYKTKDSVFW